MIDFLELILNCSKFSLFKGFWEWYLIQSGLKSSLWTRLKNLDFIKPNADQKIPLNHNIEVSSAMQRTCQ